MTNAFIPAAGGLTAPVRELILLVNAHGRPAAVRALAGLINEIDDRQPPPPGRPAVIVSPKPGRTVLACRCGKVLDLAEMRRRPPSTGDRTLVRPIVCAVCAWKGSLVPQTSRR